MLIQSSAMNFSFVQTDLWPLKRAKMDCCSMEKGPFTTTATTTGLSIAEPGRPIVSFVPLFFHYQRRARSYSYIHQKIIYVEDVFNRISTLLNIISYNNKDFWVFEKHEYSPIIVELTNHTYITYVLYISSIIQN